LFGGGGLLVARASEQIVADIHAFAPAGGNWLRLDHLLTELWGSGEAARHTQDLLAVFERFPEEAGGVLWGVLHGLESVPGYEPALVRSVRARPSEMGVMMVGRLLNGGVSVVGGVPLIDLLREVAASTAAPASVRESAAEWAQQHAEPGSVLSSGDS
jgi:hypothetical protein